MIVGNGLIYFRTNKGWGEHIICNLQAESKATMGITENGNRFETLKFEVLIEKMKIDTSVVSLEQNGKNLGVYRVNGNPTPLDWVGNIKLNVTKIGEWHEEL